MQFSAEKEQARPQLSPRDEPSLEEDGRDERVGRAYAFADLSDYPLKKRLLIRAADMVFYLLIRAIGSTVRFRVEGWEHWEAAMREGGAPVYAFWHNRILLATYYFRRRRIVVMTSQSFDGEYIARFIQRFGYGAARGSTTRGAVGALVEMIWLARRGCPTGFSIDGPRGPRHVAKRGALQVAKKAGRPVLPFAVNAESFWQVSSWDRLQIPKPFTRAVVRIAPPIHVPADSNDALIEAKRDELQRALDAISS
ncbi:MAG TPA: lysophospholipid acyltransferase family protein [Pyrinomonadaceae bacterium]|nr:lysophospholipid acyltransferase family protein [Pyrinomonadaceae bacterium]